MSILASAHKTHRYDSPLRMIIHGAPGVGKSSFAAAAPSPIFIASEDGLDNINATALPEPHDWASMLEQVYALQTETHEYKTLVIDSLDWLEPLCWAHACRLGNKPNIEAFGYGKGYVAAQNEWRVLIRALSALRARGMNVILIAHSLRKQVANPEGANYDAWQIKLHEKAAGPLVEWSDIVGFASFEMALKEVDGNVKAVATHHRELRVRPNPAYAAKTRLHLPESMTLDWASFAEAAAKARGDSVKVLASIEALLAKAEPALVTKVRATVSHANGDATRLVAIYKRLSEVASTQSQETASS